MYYETLEAFMAACHPTVQITDVVRKSWERGGQAAVNEQIAQDASLIHPNFEAFAKPLAKSHFQELSRILGLGGSESGRFAPQADFDESKGAIGEFVRSSAALQPSCPSPLQGMQGGWLPLDRNNLPAGTFLVGSSVTGDYGVYAGSREQGYRQPTLPGSSLSGSSLADNFDWYRPLPAIPGRGWKRQPQTLEKE